MRLSCNGCRVLRKGCSNDCTIRPCLQWLPTPESQANATVFLAKFYGRAGLINLINAGPQHLRPAIFKSLLYEACGRIVNPISGSAGLLWSGRWQLCEVAVEDVLRGAPITQLASESETGGPPLKACDIRHVSKAENLLLAAASDQLHKVKHSRGRFKNSSVKPKPKPKPSVESVAAVTDLGNDEFGESGVSQEPSRGVDSSGETDCVSVGTVEASLAKPDERADGSDVDVELDLTLGFGRWVPVNENGGGGEKFINGFTDNTWKLQVRS